MSLYAIAVQLYAQSRASDNAALKRMRELRELTKWEHEGNAQKNGTPLWGGPDDDPTIAADVFDHEAPGPARKAATRAEHLSKKGKHKEAILYLKRALEIDPQYYEAANNLGLEYFEAGHPEQAVETLRNLTKTDPKHVLAFDNLAIVLCRLQRYPEAEAVAAEAYRMHPFSYKAAYVYGVSLASQGKWTDDAKQALRYASVRHPAAKTYLEKWPHS